VRLHRRLAAATTNSRAGAAVEAVNPFLSPPEVSQLLPGDKALAVAATQQPPAPPAGVGADAPAAAAAEQLDPGAVQKAFQKILPPGSVPADDGEEEDQTGAQGDAGPSCMDIDDGVLYWKGDNITPEAVGRRPIGFSLEPGAPDRRRVLLARKLLPDAYAEHGAKHGGAKGGGGVRMRASRYDIDPRVRRAEEILGTGPEAIYADGGEAEGGGGGGLGVGDAGGEVL